jgi:hypothetical protein
MRDDVKAEFDWLEKAANKADMSSLTAPYGKALATIRQALTESDEEKERLRIVVAEVCCLAEGECETLRDGGVYPDCCWPCQFKSICDSAAALTPTEEETR